jgi:hypothetical protein
MYLLLLVFGALLTVAGVVLSAAGISIHERAFDTTIVTPGIVAVIGGLVLIGLGLALRVLQRIENVLATQPMPRSARFKESAEAIMALDMAPDFPAEPARPSVPRAAARAPLGARRAAAGAPPAAVEPPKDFADTLADTLFPSETPAEQSPAEASALDKAVAAQDTAKSDLKSDLGSELAAGLAAALALDAKTQAPDSLLPPVAGLNPGDDLGLLKTARAARRLNGTTPIRTAPRLDLSARFPLASDRPSSDRLSSERPKGPSFDAMWPKGPRPLRSTAPAAPQPVPEPTTVVPAAEPPANKESSDTTIAVSAVAAAVAVAAPVETPHPVSVLKSGVVDGMAYTLFSDGSIEAALPQGTLRFGSISELRQHIEQSEQSA